MSDHEWIGSCDKCKLRDYVTTTNLGWKLCASCYEFVYHKKFEDFVFVVEWKSNEYSKHFKLFKTEELAQTFLDKVKNRKGYLEIELHEKRVNT